MTKLINIRKISSESKITKYITDVPEMMGDNRQYKFVISTSDIDTSFDVVDQGGWELAMYLANPTVLWSHNSEQLPIGRCVSIGVEDGKLKATVEFATTECNPLAEQVYQSVKGGFISATSVGFMPVEWEETTDSERGGGTYSAGFDYKKNILREFSLCNVPANQYALIEPGQRADSTPTNINNIKMARERRLKILALRGRIR
jgi:HK97 family phage prohead protease